MSTTIQAGGTVKKDPDAIEVYTFDWDTHLAVGATISTSAFVIVGSDSALTKDNESILGGSRKTQVRLTGGTLSSNYTVTNRITTSESPSQTKDASMRVWIHEQ